MTKKKPTYEHTYLGIAVTEYEVTSKTGLNMDLELGRPVIARHDDPAIEFVTTLEIIGESISPRRRAGEGYKINIRGMECHPGEFSITVGDFQARDDHRLPVYKTVRGKREPVYDPPKGISCLTKQRGTKTWETWLWVAPHLVSDMLCLLSGRKPLYIEISERKEGRQRWVQGFSLRTRMPEDDA